MRRGRIPTGTETTDFLFIGETPLTHTFHTTRYQQGLMAPGVASTNSSTYYNEAIIRVEYDNGAVDERRIRLNNGEIQLSFDGAEAASASGDMAK